jgi:hypothetical protein
MLLRGVSALAAPGGECLVHGVSTERGPMGRRRAAIAVAAPRLAAPPAPGCGG